MHSLDKIRKKKYLDKTTHNLLEKAWPSKEMPEKRRKSEREKKTDKKNSKPNYQEKAVVQTFL